MRRASLLLFLVFSSPFAGGPAVAAAPTYAQFGRWLVACDNGGRCEARGLSDIGPAADIRIARAAGTAPATVTLTVAANAAPDSVRVGERTVALASPPWTRRENKGAFGPVWSFNATAAPATAGFLDGARTVGTVTFPNGAVVPLGGLAAALSQMDAVQRRADAALPPRPAWRPTTALTKREAVSLVAAARRVSIAARKGDCDYLEGDAAHALDAGHAVVMLACPADAYQGETFVFVVPRRGGLPMPFAARLPGIGRIDGRLGDTEFDAATGTLTSRSRGDGLANCGWRAAWVWSAGAFRLAALDYQRACGGTASDDWPALYRTRPDE